MTRGRVAGTVGSGGAAVPTSNASAVLGSFTTVNSFNSATGQGEDFDVSTTKFITFEKPVATWPAREDLWGFQAAAATGWLFSHSNGIISFVWRGGGGSFINLSANLLVGLHTIAITRTAAGVFRGFIDGNPVAVVSGAVTYAAAGASGVQYVGYNSVEAAGACTATSIINFGHIAAELTDADLIILSNNVNTVTRWDVPPTAAAHVSLVSAHRALDWDGTNPWVASAGSSPKTLTKRGTGGTKTALAAMQRITLGASEWLDNRFYTLETTPVNHYTTSLFAVTEFSHSGARMWVEAVSTQSSVFAYQNDLGLTVDGTEVQSARLGGLGGIECFPLNQTFIRETVTQTAASHAYTLTNGLQSRSVPAPLKGTFSQAIWVPVTETPTFTAYAAPARRLVLGLSDSTCEQLGGQALTVTTPTTDGWIMRLRASLKALGIGWRVSVEAYGSRSFGDDGKTSGGRQGLADAAASLCDGTTKNVLYVLIGVNDWGLDVYTNIATFSTDFDDYLTRLDTAVAGKTGIVKRGITPFWNTNQATINGSGAGYNLATMRSTQTTLYTAHSWNVTDGLTLITATTGFGTDGVHPLPGNPGHLEASGLIAAFAELV